MMTSSSDLGGGQFPVFDNAPLYLRESLLFPYLQGMKFQQEVVVRLGKEGFAEVYRRPPNRTQQIMHPELYLDPSPEPEPIQWDELGFAGEIPGAAKGESWKLLHEGTVGEFDHEVLLKLYAPEAAEVAASWLTGVFRLYENSATKEAALAYASRWTTPEDAGRFLDAYKKVLAGKLGPLELTADEPDRIEGAARGVAVQTWRAGDLVISAEGLNGVRLVP
jgi:hypothetical protein